MKVLPPDWFNLAMSFPFPQVLALSGLANRLLARGRTAALPEAVRFQFMLTGYGL